METGFAVTGFLGVILNLLLPQESDDLDDIENVEEEMRSFHSQHPHPLKEVLSHITSAGRTTRSKSTIAHMNEGEVVIMGEEPKSQDDDGSSTGEKKP